MKLPQQKRFPPLVFEKLSQTLQNGIVEVVLLIKGKPPIRGGRRTHLVAECEINERYAVRLNYSPNGLKKDNSDRLSLAVAVHSGDGFVTYTKIETCAIAVDGTRWFKYEMKDFYPLPLDVFWTISKIGTTGNILSNSFYFLHGDSLHFEVRISIDTKRTVEPQNTLGASSKAIQEIRDRIHHPSFGDTAFLVGGVLLRAHKDVMIRHSEMFSGTLQCTRQKGIYYEFPDTYPQVFERFLIDCYLKEGDLELNNER